MISQEDAPSTALSGAVGGACFGTILSAGLLAMHASVAQTKPLLWIFPDGHAVQRSIYVGSALAVVVVTGVLWVRVAVMAWRRWRQLRGSGNESDGEAV